MMRFASSLCLSLSPPATRSCADPLKLARMGLLTGPNAPITVEQVGTILVIQDGLTRVAAAIAAGITQLPANVYLGARRWMDAPTYTRCCKLGSSLSGGRFLSSYKWIEAEIEMLHNVPSLLGEANTGLASIAITGSPNGGTILIGCHGTAVPSPSRTC